MTPDIVVGIALVIIVGVLLLVAMAVQHGRTNPEVPRIVQERQEIIFFQPSGKFVASVDGQYLKRDFQTGYVQKTGRIGNHDFNHHATFCNDRVAAESLMKQWNAQKLRAHHSVTAYEAR